MSTVEVSINGDDPAESVRKKLETDEVEFVAIFGRGADGKATASLHVYQRMADHVEKRVKEDGNPVPLDAAIMMVVSGGLESLSKRCGSASMQLLEGDYDEDDG